MTDPIEIEYPHTDAVHQALCVYGKRLGFHPGKRYRLKLVLTEVDGE